MRREEGERREERREEREREGRMVRFCNESKYKMFPLELLTCPDISSDNTCYNDRHFTEQSFNCL